MRDFRNIRRALIIILIGLGTLAGADVAVAQVTHKTAPLQTSAITAGIVVRPASLAEEALPPSPVSGSLTLGSDEDDVFAVSLQAGQRLTLSVTSDAGADIDLYVLWPEATLLAPPYAASAYSTDNPETLTFDAPVTGTYLVDLYCAGVSTTYVLEHSIAGAVNGNDVGRVYGQDRYRTALAISQAYFPGASAEDVVLARGSDYPDALSASALAGSLGCPLLLTESQKLTPGILQEAQRLGARTVHVVGGTSAISAAVESQLEAAGLTVQRYAGKDRYVVSQAIAIAVGELSPRAGEAAFLASGEAFPDALSVSPYAYRMGYPTVLTGRDQLHASAASALASLGVRRVYISGGTSAVSAGVETRLRSLGYEVVRLSGRDRYATARVVANYAVASHWGDPSSLFAASGETFPDALAGGAGCGQTGGTMVLTTAAKLNDNARTFADAWSDKGLVDSTRVLGGESAVSRSTADALKAVVVR